MNTVRVAVSGYGVIDKRVADAVRVQPDMELVGVADVPTDWRVKAAAVLDIPVYAATGEAADGMRTAGVPVAGDLDELLGGVDAVVDCGPKGVGAANLPRYRAASVKAVLQGGEKHAVTGHSFVAQANCQRGRAGRHPGGVVQHRRHRADPSPGMTHTSLAALAPELKRHDIEVGSREASP